MKMKLTQLIALGYLRIKLNAIAIYSARKAAEAAFELFCTPWKRSNVKVPPVFEQAENISFQLDEYNVKAYRWNYPGEKKIMIIHGYESAAKNFDCYITPLVEKGYEVIAFDAPAHGDSSGKQINLPVYVKTVQTINELFGPVQGFIAHSYGGLALAHYLETIPHNAAVSAVLIAPATESTTAIKIFFYKLALNGKVRKAFDQLIYEKGGEWPDFYSITRAIKNIKANILWVHDQHDTQTPLRDALKIKDENYENVEFLITERLGHGKIYKNENVINKVIEFFDEGNQAS